MVVVGGAVETVVRRRVPIVEGADRPHLPEARQVEATGKDPRLPPHAALQVAAEVPLVDPVLPPLDRLHARLELDHRRHRGKGADLGERRRAELAGELHGDVAAKRVARHGEGREPVAIPQLGEDAQRIRREAGVIQALRQVLGPAAVPLIEPDDVEAGGEGLVGEAAHVVRVARPLETVQHQQRRAGLTAGLPVAVGQHAGVGRHVEMPGFGGGKTGQAPLARPRIQRHLVPPGPSRRWSIGSDI